MRFPVCARTVVRGVTLAATLALAPLDAQHGPEKIGCDAIYLNAER